MMEGIVKNKTFPTEKLAQVWADDIEHCIKAIPLMSPAQLSALTEADIEAMGGAELFIKAGKRIRYKTFRVVCDEYLSR
ncbi:hypothetical protein [Methylomonas sp. HYX-M1]|uniref:hypothetical protein n=1 Tax=Methylomonas sp. HYX-M1 TaxID=3139307 RepID=UPI00345BEEE6